MGTCLPARSSDGCDLGPFLAGAGALVSRSPLSARSTNCGLETIPSVLGNDGNEIRVIEQSAVATMVRRITDLRISPSHPREHTQQTSRIALRSSPASLDIHKLKLLFGAEATLVISGFLLEVIRKLRRVMTGSSRASDRLDYLRGLNEVVRTAIGQELRARYSVPEKLPDALFTLVNQLDDQQKQEC